MSHDFDNTDDLFRTINSDPAAGDALSDIKFFMSLATNTLQVDRVERYNNLGKTRVLLQSVLKYVESEMVETVRPEDRTGQGE